MFVPLHPGSDRLKDPFAYGASPVTRKATFVMASSSSFGDATQQSIG